MRTKCDTSRILGYSGCGNSLGFFSKLDCNTNYGIKVEGE